MRGYSKSQLEVRSKHDGLSGGELGEHAELLRDVTGQLSEFLHIAFTAVHFYGTRHPTSPVDKQTQAISKCSSLLNRHYIN